MNNTKTLTEKNKNRREKRRKKTAEIFTPNNLVNKMLNKLPKKVWKKEKTFFDPACGNGNFLIWILLKKISNDHDPTEALKTIYGLDIKRDNIRECRLRLLKIISLFEDVEKKHIEIIFQNIRWLNKKKWPNGSLDPKWDMSFKANYNKKNVDKWYKEILAGELKLVDLPVKNNDVLAEDLESIFDKIEYSDIDED